MQTRQKFQSTHPVRGATRPQKCRPSGTKIISIHAPRAGCDCIYVGLRDWMNNFNPRTPCGVRLLPIIVRSVKAFLFQSTHPVRGATEVVFVIALGDVISIHAPRAGCDDGGLRDGVSSAISIHAPRAGCDGRLSRTRPLSGSFQSTHPVRGATEHFLRSIAAKIFQSTHPVRGATDSIDAPQCCRTISIHAPRAGCDSRHYSMRPPTPISIHAPRAGCDVITARIAVIAERFQSTHPVRGATESISASVGVIKHFNPRTPCGVRLSIIDGIVRCLPFQSTHPVRGATSSLLQ